MNELAVSYKANDGAMVQLDPASIARYIVSGNANVSEKDVARFIAICQARKLNPLAGDCYLSVFNTKEGGTQASVIVSKDYFQDQANQNPDYDGCEGGIIVVKNGSLEYRNGAFYLPSENVVGGWAEVHLKSRNHPERVEVSMAEYDTGKSQWKNRRGTMIAKVARSQALRAAFPRSFAGVYDAAEIDEPVPVKPTRVETVQPVQPAPGPRAKPQLTAEQADWLNALCGDAATACGIAVNAAKAAIWATAPYDGGDWQAYTERARAAADAFVESHMAPADDMAEVPYEF